jgi:hypothetical protein
MGLGLGLAMGPGRKSRAEWIALSKYNITLIKPKQTIDELAFEGGEARLLGDLPLAQARRIRPPRDRLRSPAPAWRLLLPPALLELNVRPGRPFGRAKALSKGRRFPRALSKGRLKISKVFIEIGPALNIGPLCFD